MYTILRRIFDVACVLICHSLLAQVHIFLISAHKFCNLVFIFSIINGYSPA